ncbi:MAG: fasciclin domain-containing protein [Bacteroidaceae bacterium]|nr:fasciclin domain-containing protein [Bacteroidaceae bacterium]
MDSDDVGDSYRTFEGQMIADYLNSDPDLSVFTEAMQLTGTFTLLESYGKYTAFIPNNAAMQKWIDSKGKTLEQMDISEIRDMVFYHFIDGLANAVSAYKTEDFPEGSFAAQNMVGRYLTAHVRTGTGNWTIKNGDDYADIVKANNDMINGVVHVVNEVLEGNNDLLGDFVANKPQYSIFGQALLVTGWRDSLALIDDPTYVMPEGDLPHNTVGQTTTYFGSWPKQKRFLYMCFAESDSIMKLREGITSLDDLRSYAKKVYPNATDTDETSPNNSLHQFVGYHLYDVQVAKNKLVLSRGSVSSYDWFSWRDYICDANYRVEQFHIPMQPAMLLNVQNANTVDFDQSSSRTVPVLNCPFSPFDPQYSTMAAVDELNGWPIVKVIDNEADQYCQNGVLHGLNNMLVFSQEVKSRVFHRRIRTDFRTYMPEGYNNGILYDGDRSYNWFYSAFPDGFCHLIDFTSNSNTTLHYEGRTPHDFLFGDRWEVRGNFDITFTVGPVPAGSYEVRVGYTSGSSDGAVVQAYIDGQPCGIPIDTRVSAYNGDTGWIQDWLAIQESGSSRFAGLGESEEDPYGLENDKNLRNHGFMKAPNSFVGWNYHQLGYGDNLTARNVDSRLRRILGIYNWVSDGTHQFRLVAMKTGQYQLDYIEFMPIDLLDEEDQH